MHTLYRSSNQNKSPHSPFIAPILGFGAHKHQHTHTQPPSCSMSASSSRQLSLFNPGQGPYAIAALVGIPHYVLLRPATRTLRTARHVAWSPHYLRIM